MLIVFGLRDADCFQEIIVRQRRIQDLVPLLSKERWLQTTRRGCPAVKKQDSHGISFNIRIKETVRISSEFEFRKRHVTGRSITALNHLEITRDTSIISADGQPQPIAEFGRDG